MTLFGMIDLNVSIFITIGLDCYNSYSQKAVHNSCRCKYFKEDFIFQHTRCNKKFKIVFQIKLYQFEFCFYARNNCENLYLARWKNDFLVLFAVALLY